MRPLLERSPSSRMTQLGDLIAPTSIPSNAWSILPTGCKKKDRNTNWPVKAMEHAPTEGVSVRGLPARLEGEEGEEQFWFEGGSDADKRIRVEIQGAWLQNLPWHRAAHRQK
jgi:hypothetical protein